jgi:arylformamidase
MNPPGPDRRGMRRAWIDISVPLSAGLVHWPGDPPANIERIADLAKADACNVSALSLSAHTGTHLDAPLHFLAGGAGIEGWPPEATVGPCRVLGIRSRAGVGVESLRPHRIRRGERLLLKTGNSAGRWWEEGFRRDFVHLTRDAAGYLADREVRCVGIDYLSVGAATREGEEVHRLLLGASIWIVEGLDLSGVVPGRYDLVCLPLRLPGADGAPARALLRRPRGFSPSARGLRRAG